MTKYAIGDINSTARGSGARANGGKVPLDLIPIATIEKLWTDRINLLGEEERDRVRSLLHYLRGWQEGKTFWIDYTVKLLAHHTFDAANVFEYGKAKYAAWNWAKGMPWSVPLGCVLRHLDRILDGEAIDHESAYLHYGHVLCNLIMLQHYAVNYPEGDDRPPGSCFAVNEVVQFTYRDSVREELDFDNGYDELLALRKGIDRSPQATEECVGL